jgi:serine/threonine protein phosphatase PrpC
MSRNKATELDRNICIGEYKYIYIPVNMVVYEWFARISQVLAPDKKYNAEVFDEPAKQDSVSLWHVLAPDPNFTAVEDPTVAGHASLSTPKSGMMQSPTAGTPINEGGGTNPPVPTLYTPSPYRKQGNEGGSSSNIKHDVLASLQSPRSMEPFSNRAVEQQVLLAAKDRASFMTSPIASMRASSIAYRICKNNTSIPIKLKEKLRELIEDDPSLLQMRSSGTTYECPEGYTLFMAATHANQVGAMEVIWDTCIHIDQQNQNHDAVINLLSSRNLEGKTVQHLAAERGHIEALTFIQEKSKQVDTNPDLSFGSNKNTNAGGNPPLDLMGHTPLGLALLSPDMNAKKNKKELLAKLYNEADQSILGSPFPVEHRIVKSSSISSNHPNDSTLRAIAGMSEIPGKRIRMEDCTICHATDSSLIVAVCDGHGDEGHVAQYVAESFVTGIQEHLPSLLAGGGDKNDSSVNPETSSWEYVCTDLCLHIDDALDSTTLRGGTVGVLMVVTPVNIVVANVGDCRCILVQTKPSKDSIGEEANLIDQTKQLTVTENSSAAEENWLKKYTAVAITTDHKPNLPLEQERIKKSGLKVVGEKVDATLTIHKIALSDKNKLATSRAFGDFEYKANDKIDVHEQAVIAIPEVTIHARGNDDLVLIAACDGIWDVMSNEQVAMFVTQRLEQFCSASEGIVDGTALPKIGDELLLECLRRGSEDNMSVVVVALSNMADHFISNGSQSQPLQTSMDAEIHVPPKVLKYETNTV